MRALVTGGAGFIGSHLCEALVERGDRVTCVDDLSTGSRDNVQALEHHPDFAFWRHDVTAPIRFREPRLDRIYHLACPASPVAYQRDPVRTLLTAVLGTRHALELARATGARLLLASTSEVYGDPDVHPQHEEYTGNVDPGGPRSCYDEGKRAAETLCADYRRKYGTRVRVARIFNTYGPRMQPDDGRVVSTFVHRAVRYQAIPVHGEGTQTRSFCFVDDLVDGLVRLMEFDEPYAHEPVNLGRPEEVSILDLAILANECAGSQAGYYHVARPTDDPSRRRPDISRAAARLGWAPKVPLEQGLAWTTIWFASRHALEQTG